MIPFKFDPKNSSEKLSYLKVLTLIFICLHNLDKIPPNEIFESSSPLLSVFIEDPEVDASPRDGCIQLLQLSVKELKTKIVSLQSEGSNAKLGFREY